MSDKESGGGLLDQLPIDRLRTEVTELGKAMAKNGFSSAIEKVGDGTGAAGKAAESIKEGESPVKAATKAGTSALKDKVKEAVGGGGGGKKMKVVNILETIDVPVPRRVAYDKWTQFQDIPDFTRKVEKVEQKDDEKLEWKAQIFLLPPDLAGDDQGAGARRADRLGVQRREGPRRRRGHLPRARAGPDAGADDPGVPPAGILREDREPVACAGPPSPRRHASVPSRDDHAHHARAGGAGRLARRDPRQGGRQERRRGPGRGRRSRLDSKSDSSSKRSASKKSASGNGNARKSTAKKSTAKKSAGQEVAASRPLPRSRPGSPAARSPRPRRRRLPGSPPARRPTSGRPAKKTASKRTAKKASRSSS